MFFSSRAEKPSEDINSRLFLMNKKRLSIGMTLRLVQHCMGVYPQGQCKLRERESNKGELNFEPLNTLCGPNGNGNKLSLNFFKLWLYILFKNNR